ncbi:MAG: MBL fold metallo-hydrolase [Steroidobacteraceae bacterium]
MNASIWQSTLLVVAFSIAGTANARVANAANHVDTTAREPAIRVTLLGTGRPEPVIDRFGPSTLIEAGGETLLIDCGRGATQRLWQLGIPLSRVSATFITHLHSDHTVGLPDLWLTGWLPTAFGRRAAPLRVFGPTGTLAMTNALTIAFAWDIDRRGRGEGLPPAGIAFDTHDVQPGVVFERHGLRVTAFAVDHGGLLEPAYGYRVDFHGRSVVVSGDTRPSENLVRVAEGTDVLVHEVIAAPIALLERSETARRIAAFHTAPEEAGRIFTRVRPRLAVYSHVVLLTTDPAYPAPKAGELVPRTRTTYDGPVQVGEDLMEIEIGSEIKVCRRASNDDRNEPPQCPARPN